MSRRTTAGARYTRRSASASPARRARRSGWPWGVNIRLADRYRSGRVFLAGDAVHVYPPTGERVPDGPLRLADGTRARMFDLLRGPHFTLLSPDPVPRVAHGPEVRAYSPATPYGGEPHTLVTTR
ncbi:FAD-dependent monooxygenase [Nonomuraea sp. NPDC051941]|uniref:FAD-dependent monooxygenase n=1 Tax=Nonomuraea sp. NPDC051941 TaxID=3364373 RepID=UPI0037C5BB2A